MDIEELKKAINNPFAEILILSESSNRLADICTRLDRIAKSLEVLTEALIDEDGDLIPIPVSQMTSGPHA